MNKGDNRRTGGQLLVECLRANGVELAFAVPGESYLAVLDAFYDVPEIRLITGRQEGGVSMMAEAYGKLTGKPGIAFVTRGPGATNACAGLHVARQESTPMVLFIGQVGRNMTERESFQEIDYRRMLGQLTKWTAEIDDPARIPEFVSRAFHVATSGRQGPVALALPEDMLTELTTAAPCQPYAAVQAAPAAADMQRLMALLEQARQPLLLLGEGDWSSAAVASMQRFCSANQLPVVATFRCQDLFDNAHPCYIGDLGLGANPTLSKRVKEADLLIAVGGRLGEIPTNAYSLLDIPTPQQTLVHIHGGAEELNRVYQATLAINSGMQHFAAMLEQMPTLQAPAWAESTRQAHADYLNWIKPPQVPGALQMGEVMNWLGEHLPSDAILTNGAGNYTVWLHRFYQYRHFRSQLAPTCGSMGYGLPAAVAAKLAQPERTVVCFAGDGCYQMTMQEFGTAVQFGANIVVVLVNNGSWGTIRMHQEREYPERVIATELFNPDFAALAQAYGGFGAIVNSADEFPAAFEQAMAAGKPALLELRLDLEALTPRASLSDIRAQALAGKA
ncbi:MAG: thiamine pyrophosphate-binding protein [Gammaproteobacteria bacterium]